MGSILTKMVQKRDFYPVGNIERSTAIAVDQLDLSFGGIQVLKNLSIEIQAGEIAAIIGPNGAGKSSLLNVLSGIYKPNKGKIFAFGREIDDLNPNQAAHLGVARTFQNLALFSALSVADNIYAGRYLREKSHWISQLLGLPVARRERAEEIAAVEDILDFLGLSEYRNVRVSALSYGLQKRVELARALASEPKVLLLDEPMAGMNKQEKQQLSQYIRQIRDERSTTVVLIEHDIQIVLALADHVVVLDYGRKIADGTPQFVSQHPEVLTAYLGQSPVTRKK